ncbi:DUF1963 domain-containing protein [Vacuolonema iberomarrocanum]|uniref:DUF1963 domain-containing protein n=1 Tax=Vacuolonema iberomarrocanum TaxID=3454632 RepID=UPI0019E5622F|nr:DUF1963 domain-containing protein [filamentous cyanobacterium LEGE 07170]
MIHQVFDLDYWNQVFPIDRFQKLFPDYRYKDDFIRPWGITSPFHLVMHEHWKHQQLMQTQEATTPIDIFVWGYGEPDKREVTKIGGLPYYPSSRPWPRTENNKPFEFFAQFCFKDSLDICGSLPGDILVIFENPDLTDYSSGQCPIFHFEWVSIGDFPLVSYHDVLAFNPARLPCYGVIHRTSELITEPMSGIKIGGTPSWIHYEEFLPGSFLFQIPSLSPAASLPYPFVNTPFVYASPSTQYGRVRLGTYPPWHYLGHPILWTNMGCMYFFFDGSEFYWIGHN